MSDYKTSIKDLYKLRSDLPLLQEKYDMLLHNPEQGNDPRLRKQLQTLGARITKTRQAINVSITQLYSDPMTDPLLQIDEPEPVILLPLRLETRFANAGSELWIRVLP